MSIRTRIWATFLPVTFILMCLVAFLSLRQARQSYWDAVETSQTLRSIHNEVTAVGRHIETLIDDKDLKDYRALEAHLAESVAEASAFAARSKRLALDFIQHFSVISAASILLVALVCITMARSIAHPIRVLSRQARRIAEGDLSRGHVLHSYREASELFRDIETMRERLATQIAHLDDRLAGTDQELRRSATDLCKQMLAYSGRDRFVVETIDLSHLIHDMQHMLQVSVSKRVSLTFSLADELPAVEADVTQIRQVIMNLVINASEAIGENSGTITVTTGLAACDRVYLQETYLDDDLPPGDYVYAEVIDSGCGMTDEVRERLFEPFFTTKFSGRGLGMSAVLGILRGHRGAMKVSSEPGRGTTFRLLLPASPHKAEDKTHPVEVQSRWRGRGTVLLADDEEVVRAVCGLMLERAGFQVLTARDGHEALDVFQHQRQRITCVILDLTMPEMDGEEAYRRLREIDTDVPVFLSSGYSEQDVATRFAGRGLAGFIQKPYRSQTLVSMLREVLTASERNEEST